MEIKHDRFLAALARRSSLVAPDPDSGYQLAVILARMTVKMTQPNADVRVCMRADNKGEFGALIAASGVVAAHFQTVAAANEFWRSS